MNEELDIFRDAVRKFVASELAPNDARWRKQQHVDREAWLKAGQMGFLLTDVPSEYGGAGGTYAYEAVMVEELIRGGVSSLGTGVHSIVANYLVHHGTEEQKQRWLPPMARGEMIGAIAMTEPEAGSDLQGVKTRALRDGDNYIINGTKTFISNGYNADLVIVVAKTDASQGAHGVSLIMAEVRGLEGYRVGRILEKLGQHGQDTCEMFFDDCRVPVTNLIGPAEGHGFYQLMQELAYERMAISVGAVACIERAVEVTTEYVKDRKMFGRTLMGMQNTRFKLAEAKTIAHIGRVFVDSCIQRLIDGKLDAVTASMAKWWTTQMQCDVVDECLQLHGGYGYMPEYLICGMYADARVQKIYGGANEVMKEIIARSL
jgi:acyl-CoA dehydrogenase